MIEYLEQLVEEKKYQEALNEAERLLPLLDAPEDVLGAHVAKVISHCSLGQEREVLSAGSLASQLSKELGNWDAFGTVSLYVGIAYSRLGQPTEAIGHMYDFLGNLHQFHKAAEYEPVARFNLGMLLLLTDRLEEAIRSLWEALSASQRAKKFRHAHGVRQALVDAHLRVGSLKEVPRLLAQCGHFLRNNPDAQMSSESRLFHLKLRSQFALASNRLWRAEVLAVRGLQLAKGTTYEYWFHALLADVADRQHQGPKALGHALAARSCAVRQNRTDLEGESSYLLHRLSDTYSDGEEAVYRYFASV